MFLVVTRNEKLSSQRNLNAILRRVRVVGRGNERKNGKRLSLPSNYLLGSPASPIWLPWSHNVFRLVNLDKGLMSLI